MISRVQDEVAQYEAAPPGSANGAKPGDIASERLKDED